MTSAKEEAERLVNAVLPVAKQMLREQGEFSPYGGYMRRDGSIVQVGRDDRATSIEMLRLELRECVARNEAKAVTIVFPARVTPPGTGHASDAIAVLVQHRESYCAELFFPYRLKGGDLNFGQVFAQTCGTQILG